MSGQLPDDIPIMRERAHTFVDELFNEIELYFASMSVGDGELVNCNTALKV